MNAEPKKLLLTDPQLRQTADVRGKLPRTMLVQGDSVTVWNRTVSKAQALQQAGAAVALTAGEAVAAADQVHLALTDDAVVDSILAEVAPRLRRDAIVMDHVKRPSDCSRGSMPHSRSPCAARRWSCSSDWRARKTR